jgi:hypothetical protein
MGLVVWEILGTYVNLSSRRFSYLCLETSQISLVPLIPLLSHVGYRPIFWITFGMNHAAFVNLAVRKMKEIARENAATIVTAF